MGGYGYFTAAESEQFSFYRIPKSLFTRKEFEGLSRDAKLLYGILLDRLGLSRRNGWMDREGKIFIIFTRQEIMENMGIGHTYATGLLKELENARLIERRRRGMCKPDLIYVKNFSVCLSDEEKLRPAAMRPSGSPRYGHQEVRSTAVRRSAIRSSGSPYGGP